jgi:ABC-type branched-subunit amino acid transport system ATPase component
VTTVPALDVSGVDFSYGQVQVLFGIDLVVPAGEAVALLGTNGAGKSTLLKAVCGLVRPSAGTVRCFGEDITSASTDRRVAAGLVQVPGGRATFPSLTVEENLRAGAWTFRRRRQLVRERLDRVLDLFPELGDRLDAAAGTLSGGQQQMLALGRALMLDPRVLLIDELSLGLAPIVVERLLETVRNLNAAGTTVVLVEQSVNIALSLATTAYFLERGTVRFGGPAAELADRDDLVRSVFLDGAGAALATTGTRKRRRR